MQDPFIIPPIPWLQRATQPVADFLSLPSLPLHIHEVLAASLLYGVIYYPLSPILSRLFLSRHYNQLSRARKLNWDAHVVSLVQSCLINALALWIIVADDDRNAMTWQERIWGYTGASAMVQALATGYFLWDLIVTSRNMDVFGLGTLAHAVSALVVYTLGFVGYRHQSNSDPDTLYANFVIASIHQLLCMHLYPLGAFYTILEHSLVPRQTRNDRFRPSAVQRATFDIKFLLVSPRLRDLPVLPCLQRYMVRRRRTS